MKKKNILKENREFNRIISNNKPYRTKYFNIFVEKNNSEIYLFGFTVSKKLGNAVTRNKIKRRLKMILTNQKINKGFKCIIMSKQAILNLTYNELNKELLDACLKLKIIENKENL